MITVRTKRSSAAQIVVGEISVYGYMQAGPQDCYGAFHKKSAFAREHTISTTALLATTTEAFGRPDKQGSSAFALV